MTAEEMREAAARLAENGFRCRTCGVTFNGIAGHPDPECERPNWDSLSDEDKGAAIRSLPLVEEAGA